MSYQVFGLRVESDFALPELQPWAGAGDAPVDATIVRRAVPSLGAEAKRFGPGFTYVEGLVQFEIPTIGRYRVVGGERIEIEPADGATEADVRAMLLGPILSLLCYGRGLLPLHASGIVVDDGVVLIAGVSGAGKSTLAATLAAAGRAMIGDDICVLDLSGGAPIIRPGYPRLRLWEDATERLGIVTDELDTTRDGINKYHVPLENFDASPRVPRRLVILRRSPDPGPPVVKPVQGLEAATRLDIVQRPRLAAALGYRPMIFRGMTALLATCPAVAVDRSDDAEHLPALARIALGEAG